jgi:hypothetical protein
MENPTGKPTLPVTIDEVKGRDLPRAWAERAGIRPDDTVSVTIAASRRQAMRRLGPIMDRIAAQAAASGLTPEKLKKILPDFPVDLAKR